MKRRRNWTSSRTRRAAKRMCWKSGVDWNERELDCIALSLVENTYSNSVLPIYRYAVVVSKHQMVLVCSVEWLRCHFISLRTVRSIKFRGRRCFKSPMRILSTTRLFVLIVKQLLFMSNDGNHTTVEIHRYLIFGSRNFLRVSVA